MLRHALHMKCWTWCGAGIYHSNFQNFLVWLSSELKPWLVGRERFIANLYVLRTLNNPFAFSTHISLSSGGCILSGMLLIHSALCGRKSASITCAFHWVESCSINSHTFVSALRNSLGDTTWYVDIYRWQPLVSPYLNGYLLTYTPPTPLLHQILSRHDTPPHVRWICTKWSMYKISFYPSCHIWYIPFSLSSHSVLCLFLLFLWLLYLKRLKTM